MPPKRIEWLDRIKVVEREHVAIRLGTERLLADARSDPTILVGNSLRLRDVEYASARSEGTYVIRLFAEFETALRLFWAAARGGDAPARTRDLIDGVAATRRVRDFDRDSVHAVREYRNALVHEREEPVDAVSLSDARHHLCRFLSHLPLDW